MKNIILKVVHIAGPLHSVKQNIEILRTKYLSELEVVHNIETRGRSKYSTWKTLSVPTGPTPTLKRNRTVKVNESFTESCERA